MDKLSSVSRTLKEYNLNNNLKKVVNDPTDNHAFSISLMSPDQLVTSKKFKNLPFSSSFDELGNRNTNLINENSRVLLIGDSHTVGIYGHEMDKMLRQTGAKVETVGSAGSAPSWYLNGTPTHCGFYSKDEVGNTDSPKDWKIPHPTPKLNDLVGNFKPNVIIISLGANLIYASGKTIENQVRNICEVAKSSGAKIVWVGPPKGREDKMPSAKEAVLYAHLKKIASEYGTFIDSRPYTEYPATGGDGLHYSGKEGTKIAKEWSKNVFNDIQNTR